MDNKLYWLGNSAKTRLKGLNAELFTGNELQNLTLKAHFVVSFSVLEHVFDRRSYLLTAKNHLAEKGIFYLNYDDGHFRNFLDLNAPRLWPSQCKKWLHNLLTKRLAQAGKISQFQMRVDRTTIEKLIAETGFRVLRAFYSNLSSLKGLYKTIPDQNRQDFSRLWLTLENELNAKFLTESEHRKLGDTANLWQFMGSRTLVLCK